MDVEHALTAGLDDDVDSGLMTQCVRKTCGVAAIARSEATDGDQDLHGCGLQFLRNSVRTSRPPSKVRT